MELFLYLLAFAFFCGVVAAFAWLDWALTHKTGRRGSKYYVPHFTAKFDPFLPLWTDQRREYVRKDHEWWQQRFDGKV